MSLWLCSPQHEKTACGFVYLPESAPWLAAYLHELTVFPNGKHEDKTQFDKLAGEMVTVKGKVDGKTIVVESISPAKS